MTLEFRILGSFEVCGEDAVALALGGRKRRGLLALLLLNRNELVTSERLLEEVWGGSQPQRAGSSLQVYVSQLRKLLGGAQVLQTRPGGYSLAVAEDQLDAARFERLLGDAKRLLAGGQPEPAAEQLRQALALWRGPPLADLGYESFAQTEIARLEELRLVALELRIEAELALGHHGDLVGELETLVAEQPLRERLRGQLMLALYRSGRQADALAAYQEARRTLLNELGLEPSPELRELEAAILRQDASLTVEPAELRARRHLPAPATALVGRENEVAEIVALLRRTTPRLVTLTGTGGTGKTRLGLQAAADVVESFADGVFFIALAPLGEPELVAATIAQALGFRPDGEETELDAIKAQIRDWRLLLLLDNFEHVDEAAPVVSELLAEASGLKVLVTSRAALRLYGEHEYPVPPLTEEEAVELFATRARAVQPRFEQDRSALAELCQNLDCLPLAIELAAARSGELSPAEMLAVLPHRLELATGGARDLPARHQTLWATVEWSYGLLDESEQALFARLAVFAGGWALEAAQSVCDADPAELASLVEKSLVLELRQPDDEPRFGMLETIREFAEAKLAASGTGDEVRTRHFSHFLALAEEGDEALAAGRESAGWLDRLELEHDNFRAALDRINASELRLAAALGRFWEFRGHAREGLGRLDRALEHADGADGPLRVRALLRAGVFAHMQGDLAGATRRMEAALSLAGELGDERMAANAMRNLGTIAKDEGDFSRALELHQRARRIADALGDRAGVSSSLINLADVNLAAGDHAAAEALAREGVALARELGHETREVMSLLNLGLATLELGRDAEATAAYAGALTLCERLSYGEGASFCFLGLAALLAQAGDHRRAAVLLGAAEAQLEAAGAVLESTERPVHDRTVQLLRDQLDPVALGDAWAEGGGLSLDEAISRGQAAAADLEVPPS